MENGYSLLSRGERLGRTSFLMSCSKPLYKWKSWEAGSNRSNKVISIIHVQWQLTKMLSNPWKRLDNQCRSFRDIDIYQKSPRGNINIVSGNATCTPSSFLKRVLNKIRTHIASCNIDTVQLKVSLYTRWLSEYSCSQNTYTKNAQWLY